MRVLFCTTGGLGHLLPLRPLAQALRTRDHEVAWATAPDALSLLAGLGFDLFPAGPGFDESRRNFRSAFPGAAGLAGEALSAYTFPRLFGGILAPAMLAALEEAVLRWRPDFVVHEPAALAAPLVCQSRGLRHIAHGYGLRPPVRVLSAAMEWLGPHWHARGLRASVDGDQHHEMALDIAPECMEPWPALDHRRHRFNPHRPVDAPLSSLPIALQGPLGPTARRPRIYLTFGTVFNHSPALATAARASARLGGTLVVTVGANADPVLLAGLPACVHVLPFVEQRALLPHCDAVVSHGGAGTVLGSAAHGLPQLVLPQAADHFRNARALCTAGAGLAVEPCDQNTERLESALSEVLSSPSMAANAQRLAQEMAALPDAAEMARRIEQWHAFESVA